MFPTESSRGSLPLEYSIKVELEVGEVLVSGEHLIKQDVRDVLRQEYVDTNVSDIPARKSLVDTSSHSYLNFGTYPYWIVNWITDLNADFVSLGIPKSKITSAYRNPIKEMSLVKGGYPTSYHVFGAAIDFDLGTSTENYNLALKAVGKSSPKEVLLYVNVGKSFISYDVLTDTLDPPDVIDYAHGHIGWSNW